MARILQITDKRPGGGGIWQVVRSHAALLEGLGHGLSRLTLGSAEHPIMVKRRLDPDHPLLQGIARMAEQADVIHLHLGFLALSPDLVTRAAERARLIVLLHDVSPFRHLDLMQFARSPRVAAAELRLAPVRREVWRQILTHADAIVAPSRFLADQARSAGADPGRVTVIPPALEPHRSRGRASDQAPTVLYVGQLSEPKGVLLLIEAFAAMKTRQASLNIIGSGPLEKRLKDRVQALGIAERVTFLGPLDADGVRIAMRQARVLAHPSLVDEGFGLVGIEALQQARPVVSFATGGAESWLRHGQTGLRVTPSTATAFAAALDRIVNDPALADQLGAAGRAFVEETHGPGRIAGLIEEVSSLARAGAA